MRAPSSRLDHGFSLLEVMVAVAILGLALTVILSAQGGLAASNKAAANMGTAASLGRCKMTEIEESLLKLGYPQLDDLQTEVACCNDENDAHFSCDTRVEKVVLPNPPSNSIDDGGTSLSLSGDGGSSSSGGGLSGLSNLASQALAGGDGGAAGLNGLGLGSSLGGDGGVLNLSGDGGLGAMGSLLDQQMGAGGQGTQGLLQMVLGIVYPSLKLMMEASIRRLTVTVRWHEGSAPKELVLTQFVTNPQQFQSDVSPTGSATPGATGLPTSTSVTGGLGATGR